MIIDTPTSSEDSDDEHDYLKLKINDQKQGKWVQYVFFTNVETKKRNNSLLLKRDYK